MNEDALSVKDNQKWIDDANKERKSLIHRADDLEVGQLVAVYNFKKTPNEPAGIYGQAMTVKAVNLPFIVCSLYANGEILTLDDRYVNLMLVTEDFAKAQKESRRNA